MTRTSVPFVVALVAAAAASGAGCGSSHDGPAQAHGGASSTDASADASTVEAGDGEAGVPFVGDPPSVYVAKVKNLLVALPPTDDEVSAVAADPSALGGLIGQWMAMPEYTQKMMRFFELAFQQTQVTAVDFADQAYPDQVAINATTTPMLVQNAQESFARTALQIVGQNQPLTAAATTTQFMMTTAMKELYAFLDVWEVDDTGTVTDYFHKANPSLSISVSGTKGSGTSSSTTNTLSFYDPDVATAYATNTACQADPIVYASSAMALHYLLYGSLLGRKTAAGVQCPPFSGSVMAPQLSASDFSDWTMVTVRAPNAGEATTTFYDLSTLRSATELVLNIPRVGFFSTPAFFANWQTNTSNTMRVTMNQALIVATGAQVDGTDSTVPTSTPGLDTTHANQPACYNCHKLLDPTRSIFSSTWSWNYHAQLDSTLTSQPGLFAFEGVVKPMTTLADFGAILAAHPRFASGWVQRLCTYANSSPCDVTDPAFVRIVTDFQSSGFSWSALVKELFASPLVTNAANTATWQENGEVVAVSRRDHICAAYDARLGFTDVCSLTQPPTKGPSATIAAIVAGLPSDAYGRGAVAPILPNQPTLFFRAATENICEELAVQLIDVPSAQQVAGTKQWSSAQPGAAIADFVSLVMGLPPSDPRSAQATSILTSHFTSAMAEQGITPTQALESTFVTACLAPSATAIGM